MKNFSLSASLTSIIAFCLWLNINAMNEAAIRSTYNAQRTSNLYSIDNDTPYKISRSKFSDFLKCPRCFYLDRKCGVGRPPSFPFTLNNAVDALLKKEFDYYRAKTKQHPIFIENKLHAVPFKHQDIDKWRDSLHHGIQYLDPETNLILHGGIDDIWINIETQELIVADYKATSKPGDVSLDAPWQIDYKRQIEVYQWILRKMGFKVSNIGYFVYCNADAGRDAFEKTLQFKMSLLPYEGDDSWIEDVLHQIKDCLNSETIPKASPACEYCQYCNAIKKHIKT